MKTSTARGILSAAVLFGLGVACGGERLPASSARPVGEKWFCAADNWSACGRTKDDCATQNARIGSRVVSPGSPPAGDACAPQELATCYTYYEPTAGKTLYDCFRDRIECDGFRREAERAPAQHQDLSVCGSWD